MFMTVIAADQIPRIYFDKRHKNTDAITDDTEDELKDHY